MEIGNTGYIEISEACLDMYVVRNKIDSREVKLCIMSTVPQSGKLFCIFSDF